MNPGNVTRHDHHEPYFGWWTPHFMAQNSNLGFVSDYFGVRSLCKSSGDKGQPQRNHCTWVWLKNGYQWTHKSCLVQCLTISNDGAVKKNCWAIPSEAQPLAPPSEGLLVQIPAAGPRPVTAQDYRPQNLFSQTDQNRIPLLQVDYPSKIVIFTC